MRGKTTPRLTRMAPVEVARLEDLAEAAPTMVRAGDWAPPYPGANRA